MASKKLRLPGHPHCSREHQDHGDVSKQVPSSSQSRRLQDGVEGDTVGFSELLGLEGVSCGGAELRRERGDVNLAALDLILD